MSVDYNKFAKTFSSSRKNMKWEEINYFLSFLWNKKDNLGQNLSILDIWCWNWRLLSHIKNSWFFNNNLEKIGYLWIDLSEQLLKEAKEIHPENEFMNLNMLDIDKITKKFDYIFFIASFHHLDNLDDRLEVLEKAYKLLNKWWKIFMTNWALNSSLNKDKYLKYFIKDSQNKFCSLDYNIKIGEYFRYYHCFSLVELDFLFKKIWFEVVENRLFDNKRNFISILKV